MCAGGRVKLSTLCKFKSVLRGLSVAIHKENRKQYTENQPRSQGLSSYCPPGAIDHSPKGAVRWETLGTRLTENYMLWEPRYRYMNFSPALRFLDSLKQTLLSLYLSTVYSCWVYVAHYFISVNGVILILDSGLQLAYEWGECGSLDFKLVPVHSPYWSLVISPHSLAKLASSSYLSYYRKWTLALIKVWEPNCPTKLHLNWRKPEKNSLLK